MATQESLDLAQTLYVAYYGRPADRAGLNYWADEIDANGVDAMVNAFGNSAEFEARFGNLSNEQLINNLYQQMFGRSAELAGLDFYSAQLANGESTLAEIALDIANGAQNEDATALSNKVAVAANFTAAIDTTEEVLAYAGDSAANSARDFLATVNAETDAETVDVDAQLSSLVQADQDETTAGETFTLTTGVDSLTGTGGDDSFNATETATSSVLGGLDVVDGAAGNDTLNVADTATAPGNQFSLPAGFTIQNVENVNVTTNGGVSMDVSGITGLEAVKTVAAGTANTSVTAAGTTDVTTTVAGAATTTINGGQNVSVTAGTGAVTVGVPGAAATKADAIETVSVKGGGVVSIDNTGGAAGTTTAVGTTLTAVTLDNVNGGTAAVKGAAVEELTVKNQDTALATTVTNGTSKALTVNVDNAGYDSTGAAVAGVTVAAGAAAETINVNASGSKSNVTVNGAAAKTLNIAGDAALTLASTTAFTKLNGSTATGNLVLGDLNAATVTVDTGAGDDSFAIQATNKTTVNTNAGDDTVTLKSAVAAGSTINLGAGSDALLGGAGGSVAASTATATTTIDAGEGQDTVAASLINAANAAQFVNFEALDLSAAANLDVELMTASTVESLTLTGGAGGATVTNVAAGVGLTVSGSNTGTTTIGVKGATAAASTDDSFAITFDGEAASTATATAKTAVDAGTVALAGVESVSIDSSGEGFVANNSIVTATSLQSLTITGDKDLDLDFGANTGNATAPTAQNGLGVASIDGSAATGALDINTTGVTAATAGLTVKGGSANDVITLAQAATVEAGAGNDTITSSANGGTFTGGAGNDEFDVSLAVATGTTEATSVLTTIADFSSGDKIDFAAGASGAFNSTKVDLDATVTNLDAALAQVGGANAANETSWFQYGNNTYIVSDIDGGATFSAGDSVVKLTGLVDLSDATLTGTELSLA
jgi:S-layer protein